MAEVAVKRPRTAERDFSDFKTTFEKQKRKSLILRTSSVKERIQKLRKIENWIDENKEEIYEALYNDFRKPEPEVDLTEIFVVQTELRHTIKHLSDWMKPKKVPGNLAYVGTKSHIQYEPKGICLIIAPWNYPFNLMLGPLVSCIAAGNTSILKPSEVTPHTARLIRNMIETLFEPDEVAVFEGDKDVAEALLKLPFDHIFFTGSPAIGKVIMKAAAENLTSVTLELGGKSPTIVDKSANIKEAAERIAWGKWTNNGQTCIAPDYVLVDVTIKRELLLELELAVERMYKGNESDIKASKDYARIVNNKQYERLTNWLHDAIEKGANVAFGGNTDARENYIAPTVLTNVPEEAIVMQEEIFGPILPIKTFSDLREVVEYINEKPKPLALYLFTNKKKNRQYILEQTSAGGVSVNDCMQHFLQPNLPFGGVNNSGLGKSHGHWGFLAFSNEKPVLKQKSGLTNIRTLYPPYTDRVKRLIKLMMKYL